MANEESKGDDSPYEFTFLPGIVDDMKLIEILRRAKASSTKPLPYPDVLTTHIDPAAPPARTAQSLDGKFKTFIIPCNISKDDPMKSYQDGVFWHVTSCSDILYKVVRNPKGFDEKYTFLWQKM